ncbi:MAG: HlyC/CorC family transporter [Dehalococcoidia bacterium]|nr:HlyC/CorC family transporter [Dehalococcoidia bacterium]
MRPLTDLSLGILALVLALLLLVLVAASEAGVAAASRLRLRALAARGIDRAETLHGYVEERASILGALAVARNVAVVAATALAVFLLSRATGHSWPVLAAIGAGAAIVIALLDAVPRLAVARAPESWGIRLVPVVRLVRGLFGPLAWAIDRSLGRVVGHNGEQPGDDAEAILRIVEDEEGEEIEEDERQMIRGIIDMEDTTAREIMVPRIDITALDEEDTLDDALRVIVQRGYSRVPLYNETIDNITGIIYAKDLLRLLTEQRRPPLAEIARPAYFIPESKKVDELLGELRASKVHIAIVVDEYGGTAGLVTIEDLIEEIVGEIQDEYDREEAPIERVSDSEAILDARVSVDALTELFGFAADDQDEYDTIGGFVYHHLGKVPIAGDEVRVDGLTLRVLSVIGRRIKKVRARRVRDQGEAAAR